MPTGGRPRIAHALVGPSRPVRAFLLSGSSVCHPNPKEVAMKRFVVSLAVLMLCLGTLAGAVDAGEKVVLPRYPDLKIGITTANLLEVHARQPGQRQEVCGLRRRSTDSRGSSCEIPVASLTLAECKEIAVYAKQRDIEMSYAVNAGILDPNYREVFSRAVANAAVFDGPRTVRTALPGLEFATNEKKTAWTLRRVHQARGNGKPGGQHGEDVRAAVRGRERLGSAEGRRGDQLRHDGVLRQRERQCRASSSTRRTSSPSRACPAKVDPVRGFLERHSPPAWATCTSRPRPRTTSNRRSWARIHADL